MAMATYAYHREADSMSRKLILKHAVLVLSLPAEQQEQYLKDLGHFEDEANPSDDWNVDELGLQLEDAIILSGSMKDAGEITVAAYRTLTELNSLLNRFSGEEYSCFWTLRALRTDARWDEIRTIAAECLNGLSA
jgi:hypothetical protein